MLSYIEKSVLFFTLMTSIILISRLIDISIFKDEGFIAFIVISFYASYLSCFVISLINFVKFIEELVKKSEK